jgi:hypothetical protein
MVTWILAFGNPSRAAEECTHSVCQVGSAPLLPATPSLGCSPCVLQVCEADPYCCSTFWDGICVQEVKTVCFSDECAPGAIVIDAFDSGMMGVLAGNNVSVSGSITVSDYTSSGSPPTAWLRQWHKFHVPRYSSDGKIVSAQLQLEFPPGAYGSNSPFLGLTVWDVTSDLDSFGWDILSHSDRPYSSAVFEDLGGGVSYGVRYYTPADERTLTVIQLNDSGVQKADIGGDFAVGAAGPSYVCVPPWCTSPPPPQFIFLNTGPPWPYSFDPTSGDLPTVRRLVLVPSECANGVDDDGDGLIDYPADRGCWGIRDESERGDCEDGKDNDGDGKIDYVAGGGGDPGCYSAFSTRENPECQDGLNNDFQTGIDFDGGASVNGGVPLDVRDPQCTYGWQNKERSGCGLGFEIVLIAPLLARLTRKRPA